MCFATYDRVITFCWQVHSFLRLQKIIPGQCNVRSICKEVIPGANDFHKQVYESFGHLALRTTKRIDRTARTKINLTGKLHVNCRADVEWEVSTDISRIVYILFYGGGVVICSDTIRLITPLLCHKKHYLVYTKTTRQTTCVNYG